MKYDCENCGKEFEQIDDCQWFCNDCFKPEEDGE